MNAIGITQSRLSRPNDGRIQSFPVETWENEFTIARKVGIDYIEWVYQAETESLNPLSSDDGLRKISEVAASSGVGVSSVTVDYYMTHRLVASDGTLAQPTIEHFILLLRRAKRLGVRYVMPAFVDGGQLRSDAEIDGFRLLLLNLRGVLDELGDVGIFMETDLAPSTWADILQQVSHEQVRVCYDTGDRASQGHDAVEDFEYLGKWLGAVHIKDRILGGGSVPLGTGATNFATCFRLIHDADYRGVIILQTAREESGSEVELAVRNIEFVRKHLATAARK
jgi:L-ribulose-5-phosphate 3-epimerase